MAFLSEQPSLTFVGPRKNYLQLYVLWFVSLLTVVHFIAMASDGFSKWTTKPDFCGSRKNSIKAKNGMEVSEKWMKNSVCLWERLQISTLGPML